MLLGEQKICHKTMTPLHLFRKTLGRMRSEMLNRIHSPSQCSSHLAIGFICGVLLTTLILYRPNLQLTEEIPVPTSPVIPRLYVENVRTDKILCWVVTSPNKVNKFKADIVKETWGARCDKLLFVSSKNDSSLPAIGLPIGKESRSKLWEKAKLTLKYVYQHHLNDYDWFFKADDDTYAIMENLRQYLSTLNPQEPLFLGHEFGVGNTSFLSGGAGYVLTRETLKRLVEEGIDKDVCPKHFTGEEDDVTITQCLYKLGAVIPSTSDERGYHRFISCNPEQFYNGQTGPVNCGSYGHMNCMSRKPFTFHYVSGYKMLMHEYLIYHLKVDNQVSDFFVPN